MRKEGNVSQWMDFDALKASLIHEIQEGNSYLAYEDNEILGVFSLLSAPEPTYQKIEGNWIGKEDYYVIHRLVSSFQKKGIGEEILRHCLSLKRHIRIDTHSDNKTMQHILTKLGFSYCGIIHLQDGSPRLVYEKEETVTESLLYWYRDHRRILPWREDPTPYHVWISEIMLQQTRVESVKGYYQRFLNAFPDIPSLAKSSQDTYLKLWQGLGYYSRIENIHKTACILQEKQQDIPQDYDSLRKLSGIGDYTANAILAIAYQKKAVAVDGNLMRVYSRLEAIPLDPTNSKSKEECRNYFLPLLGDRPGDFNQALMDLGELICLPHGNPLCDQCPLSFFCKAHKEGKETSYPLPKKKIKKEEVQKTVFVIEYENKILLHKRDSKGLLANLYEYPNVDKFLTQNQALDYLRHRGIEVSEIHPRKEAKHVFTHLIWHMKAYYVQAKKLTLKENETLSTIKDRQTKYSLPTAFLKVYSA